VLWLNPSTSSIKSIAFCTCMISSVKQNRGYLQKDDPLLSEYIQVDLCVLLIEKPSYFNSRSLRMKEAQCEQ
jgi:hypothetical protein